MPPLTIAFISPEYSEVSESENAKKLVEKNIEDAFVLDGIQRLNTLHRASLNSSHKLDLSTPLYLNILVCASIDSLLYRMITLNNGQKPMTARHQIEILTQNVYRFEGGGVAVQTEKERSKKLIVGSFDHASFVKAYLSFLSQSTNIDNRKLIEEKLDELIAGKILDSDITQHDIEFSEVVALIGDLSSEPSGVVKDWFKSENNLIGFCVGIIYAYYDLRQLSVEDFRSAVELFEQAFSYFDFSRIKVGQERRRLVAEFISKIKEYSGLEAVNLMGELSEK